MKRLQPLLLLSLIAPLSLTACGDSSAGDGDGDTSDASGDGDGDASTSGSEGETTAETTGDGDGDGDTGTDNYEKWEIRMPDYSPPAFLPTYYSCYSQTIEVDSPIQLVGFEPSVTDPHIHHYVVQVLETPTNDNPADPCLEEPWDDMIWGWAPGGESLFLPEDVGFLAGESGTVTIRFQVHYNNPLNDSFTDNGGFDVFYVKDNLRPNNAGIATFGDINNISIPADSVHQHTATCSSAFTENAFPDEMHVIGSWLHAHEVGSKLWGEIVPAGGGEPYELGREDPYYFDKQTFKPITGVSLFPGDEVRTHCEYDNTGNSSPVQGGPQTQDEMCIHFVMYYPKSDAFDECGNL